MNYGKLQPLTLTRPYALATSRHGHVAFSGITPGGGGPAAIEITEPLREWLERLAASPTPPPASWQPAGDPGAPLRESTYFRNRRRIGEGEP